MSEMELHRGLKELVAEIIEIDDFDDDDNFVAQLGVDSMMLLEIVARTEMRYRIRIPEDFFGQMTTMNEIVRIVAGIFQPVNS